MQRKRKLIIDSHVHLFSPKVIENVSQKTGLVERLHLRVEGADKKITVDKLTQTMHHAQIDTCLLLPTDGKDGVAKTNDRYWKITRETTGVLTAGTLHPGYPDNPAEIERFKDRGIKGIKFSSFSQGFALDAPKTIDLFDRLHQENQDRNQRFFVVLDTFHEANRFFGTSPRYTTTPERLGHLVKQYPGIPFIAAHMGGLTAPFEDICNYLPPSPNLFLDTSNAAHTLDKQEFIHLLKTHGAEHVIFGTDWPWFDPAAEKALISGYLEEAGFSIMEKDAVFGGNIERLLFASGGQWGSFRENRPPGPV
jgi:predicted TIM-barrel fold metal-dependent hydrolase